ncbi:unnamed protein product [Protopolystoma xenopodis]|uniref:Uncharacterized protein n=1 Tax=Protopolystoma xenopodis TaxID=117903 RepID=A0A3S5FGZ1_9PLAT|nr:unnamed protein product [Protopolystoma xenopodis]
MSDTLGQLARAHERIPVNGFAIIFQPSAGIGLLLSYILSSCIVDKQKHGITSSQVLLQSKRQTTIVRYSLIRPGGSGKTIISAIDAALQRHRRGEEVPFGWGEGVFGKVEKSLLVWRLYRKCIVGPRSSGTELKLAKPTQQRICLCSDGSSLVSVLEHKMAQWWSDATIMQELLQRPVLAAITLG